MTSYAMVLAAVAALISSATAPLQAQPMGGPPMGGPPMMGGPHMGRMMPPGDSPAMLLPMVLKQADLTPDQHSQVRKIMDADHQSLRALFARLQTANQQLADKLFSPGNLQPADLTPLVQHITELRQQLMQQGVKTALAVRAVLTPEQLTKVSQLRGRVEKLQTEMRSLMQGDD